MLDKAKFICYIYAVLQLCKIGHNNKKVMTMAESIYELKANIFKALSHPTRVRILDAMRGKKQCACTLAPELGIEQSNFSRHIASLKMAGLVHSWKEGVSVYFAVSDPRIFDIMDTVNDILKRRIQSHHQILA